MDPNVSTRGDSQLMERCLFPWRREGAFKVANLPSGFDDGTMCSLLCLKGTQLFSGPLTLFQIVIEETKPARSLFFLPELDPAATGTTFRRQGLASQPPNALRRHQKTILSTHTVLGGKESLLVSVPQQFGSYLFCFVKLCRMLPGNLTVRIYGNLFPKQFIYW